MNTAAENLQAMRELLSDPYKWAKGALVAVTEDQRDVRFCLVGSRFYAYQTLDDLRDEDDKCFYEFVEEDGGEESHLTNDDPACQILAEVILEQYPEKFERMKNPDVFELITHFNDPESTKHDDLMRVLDKAVVKASEQI